MKQKYTFPTNKLVLGAILAFALGGVVFGVLPKFQDQGLKSDAAYSRINPSAIPADEGTVQSKLVISPDKAVYNRSDTVTVTWQGAPALTNNGIRYFIGLFRSNPRRHTIVIPGFLDSYTTANHSTFTFTNIPSALLNNDLTFTAGLKNEFNSPEIPSSGIRVKSRVFKVAP